MWSEAKRTCGTVHRRNTVVVVIRHKQIFIPGTPAKRPTQGRWIPITFDFENQIQSQIWLWKTRCLQKKTFCKFLWSVGLNTWNLIIILFGSRRARRVIGSWVSDLKETAQLAAPQRYSIETTIWKMSGVYGKEISLYTQSVCVLERQGLLGNFSRNKVARGYYFPTPAPSLDTRTPTGTSTTTLSI